MSLWQEKGRALRYHALLFVPVAEGFFVGFSLVVGTATVEEAVEEREDCGHGGGEGGLEGEEVGGVLWRTSD